MDAISAGQIGWGKYQQYSGPVFYGDRRFEEPSADQPRQRLVRLMTETEGGGTLNPINMLDRCQLSIGLFQACEAVGLTTKLLNRIANVDPALLGPIQPKLAAADAMFSKGSDGKWAFRNRRGEKIDTMEKRAALLFLRSDGKVWPDEESKLHAKEWAAAFANLLRQDGAVAPQIDFCCDLALEFATTYAKSVLFHTVATTGWAAAQQAIYLSFAGNLPAVAEKGLRKVVASTGAPAPTKDWTVALARELAFGPNITIFPGRYNKIRPYVERYYGVDLPDFADELKQWKAAQPSVEGAPDFDTVEEIQSVLIGAGYDLGPAGADGRIGPKTRAAIMDFQTKHGLKADAQVGPKTKIALSEAWKAQHQ